MRKIVIHLLIVLGLSFPSFASAQSQTVPAGWSMLGNDSGAAIDVGAIFGNATTPTGISASVTTVWSWSNALGRWNFYAPSMTPQELTSYAASKGYGVLSSIAKGEGFWVNAKSQVAYNIAVTPTVEINSNLIGTWNATSYPQSGEPTVGAITFNANGTFSVTGNAISILAYGAGGSPTTGTWKVMKENIISTQFDGTYTGPGTGGPYTTQQYPYAIVYPMIIRMTSTVVVLERFGNKTVLEKPGV